MARTGHDTESASPGPTWRVVDRESARPVTRWAPAVTVTARPGQGGHGVTVARFLQPPERSSPSPGPPVRPYPAGPGPGGRLGGRPPGGLRGRPPGARARAGREEARGHSACAAGCGGPDQVKVRVVAVLGTPASLALQVPGELVTGPSPRPAPWGRRGRVRPAPFNWQGPVRMTQ